MIWKQARYTAERDELAAVVATVERFVAAVRENEPRTFYRAWQRQDDELAFVHVMGFPDDDAEQAHRRASYTLEFVDALYPRCREEPTFVDLRPLGEP